MVRSVLVMFLLLAGPVWAAGTYTVVKRGAAATVDGQVDEAVWADVPAIAGGFHYPWEREEAPKTVFKAFHDGTNFYFSFICADAQVLVKSDFSAGERATVDVEDRVELFFAPAPIDVAVDYDLPTYYNVEVDPAGRVHDYSMVFYRGVMDSDWNLPGLKTAGCHNDLGYTVEGMIPLASLRDLELFSGDKADTILTGVFRAEFSGSVDAPDKIVQRWISWIDPEVPVPDYHVAEAFGKFVFMP